MSATTPMLLKNAARITLHRMGGLTCLRRWRRREFGVLMFHSFSNETRSNLEAICSHITRHFEPVPLSTVCDAIQGKQPLPDNAVALTIDDGYRNFLHHGHPIFQRHRIPTTVYAVAGFSEGGTWLWPDRIDFALRQSTRAFITVSPGEGTRLEFPLRTEPERAEAISRLTEALKNVPNDRRLALLADLENICGVEIPAVPPVGREAMTWDELKSVAADGVEIGCHTETHPILSRLSGHSELDREIRGAKLHLEERLGFPVRHFCYPNGRPEDVGPAAIRCVAEAGYSSAVTCSWGLNTADVEPFQIRRIPFDSTIELGYGAELMAGLHM